MLTRIMKPRDDRDAGFTLIELLVVVVIIGILAAIAIPVFLNQRNAARNASVESDIRNIATVMETYYTQNDALPDSRDVARRGWRSGLRRQQRRSDGQQPGRQLHHGGLQR